MSSAASRLISFSNNASLQNLMQRKLLGPSASAASGASVTQLLSTVSDRRFSSHFNTENPKPYFNTLPVQKASYNAAEIMKEYYSDGHFPVGMFGLSGVDQSGIVKIHTRPTDLPDDNDEFDSDSDSDSDIDINYSEIEAGADVPDDDYSTDYSEVDDGDDDDDDDDRSK